MATINLHTPRHTTQERFEQVAGIPPPLADGPKHSELTRDEQIRWEEAAAIVNWELGHGEGRKDITATNIGTKD